MFLKFKAFLGFEYVSFSLKCRFLLALKKQLQMCCCNVLHKKLPAGTAAAFLFMFILSNFFVLILKNDYDSCHTLFCNKLQNG